MRLSSRTRESGARVACSVRTCPRGRSLSRAQVSTPRTRASRVIKSNRNARRPKRRLWSVVGREAVESDTKKPSGASGEQQKNPYILNYSRGEGKQGPE